MTIRLMVCDVDGTLVTPDKELTPRTCETVRRLREAGIPFTITSGRPPRGMAMLREALRLSSPIAAFNGGMIVQPDLTTMIQERKLPLAVARSTVDYLLDSGLDAWVYRGSDWFVRDPNAPHVEHERDTVQFDPVVIEDIHSVLDGAVKIVGVSDDTDRMERCAKELKERLKGRGSASRSQTYYLDVTHPEANKGSVVRLMSRHFNVPLNEIAVIGDMPSDVPMFQIAGLSIAMGNASASVRSAARYVTTSNVDEGFANAVDRFILGHVRTSRTEPVPDSLGLPSQIRACLFDLDGVLTQTAKIHAKAWKEMFDDFLRDWAEHEGRPFVPFDAVRDYDRYVDGKLRVDGAKSFLVSRGIQLPEWAIAQLASRKDAIVAKLFQSEHVDVYPGSVRYVQAVRAAGLRTAVVSSSRHCQQVLASAGIPNLFDVRIDGNVIAAQHLSGKPAPDSYLAAARAVGVDPSQAVVFEDALSGVEAGRSGNFGYVVGVDRVGQSAELKRHGADIAVKDLSDLMVHPMEKAG